VRRWEYSREIPPYGTVGVDMAVPKFQLIPKFCGQGSLRRKPIAWVPIQCSTIYDSRRSLAKCLGMSVTSGEHKLEDICQVNSHEKVDCAMWDNHRKIRRTAQTGVPSWMLGAMPAKIWGVIQMAGQKSNNPDCASWLSSAPSKGGIGRRALLTPTVYFVDYDVKSFPIFLLQQFFPFKMFCWSETGTPPPLLVSHPHSSK